MGNNNTKEHFIHSCRTTDNPRPIRRALQAQPKLATCRDAQQRTALHHAAEQGHVQVARVLLDHDAEVLARDGDGWTPLHLAAWNGHDALVRLLLEYGAQVRAGDARGVSPLHRAACNGHDTVVRVLLDHDAEVNVQDKHGDTPLHVAAWYGHEAIVRQLLERGADRDVKNIKDATARDWAELSHKPDVVDVLDSFMAVAMGTVMEEKEFIRLCYSTGYQVAVRHALEQQPELVACRDTYWGREGWTPLHHAAKKGDEHVIKVLLEHGAEVNAREDGGHTPLHNAAYHGRYKVAQVLLDHGAEVDVTSKQGKTPLHLAALSGYERVVDALLKSGADGSMQDDEGKTARDVAKRNNKRKVVALLDSCVPVQPSREIIEQVNTRLAECVERALHDTTTAARAEAVEVAAVKEQLRRQAERIKELEVDSPVQEKQAVLEMAMQRAEQEHRAALQRQHIRATPQLECYYEGFKLLLNSAFLSALAMVGGFTQLDDGQSSVGKALEKVGQHVPFVGVLFSLLGVGITAVSAAKKRHAICAVAGMASSAGEMERFVEHLGRELTLDQESTLLEVGMEEESGWFARKLAKKAKSPVDVLPEEMREKVKGDAGCLLTAVVAGELSVPVREAVLLEYVECVLGHALMGRAHVELVVDGTVEAGGSVQDQLRVLQERMDAQQEVLGHAQDTASAADLAALQTQLKRMTAELHAVKKKLGPGNASPSGGGQLQLSARPEDVERVQSVKVNLAQLHHQLAELQHAMSHLAELPDRLDSVERRVDETSVSSSRTFALVSVTQASGESQEDDMAALHERLAEQERRHAEELAQQAAELAELKAMMHELSNKGEE